MRLTLNDEEIRILLKALASAKHEKLISIHDKLHNQFEAHTSSNKAKKQIAMGKATKVREKAVRDKIYNAINILRLENEKITVYSVSKKAEVSFNSANKYRDIIEANSM